MHENMYVSYTYSCVDMCAHTNQYGSCYHPKQTLPQILCAPVSFETIALLPIFNCKLIVLHDGVTYTY